MMMNDELGQLTGDNAVTYVDNMPAKYRAIDTSLPTLSSLPNTASSGPFLELNLFTQPKIRPLPLSKLESSVSTTSTASNAELKSRCPEKPCFLSSTTFHASESNYDNLKELVEKALYGMEDYDWSYFPNECMWKCKFLQGSSLRELHVLSYWDSRVEDHIIEVKRVKGDGMNQSSTDFFGQLKSIVTNTIDDGLHNKRGKLRGPLPLPLLPLKSTPAPPSTTATPITTESNVNKPPALPLLPLKGTSGLPLPPLGLSRGGNNGAGRLSGGSLPLPMCCGITPPAAHQVTEEQFLKGIRPIFSMASDGLFEPRLEAAKMLCDLAMKERKFLELLECQHLCFKSLCKLLFDPFEDVKQFAVIAFALFVEIPVYQRLFMTGSSGGVDGAVVPNKNNGSDGLGESSEGYDNSILLSQILKLVANQPMNLPAYYSAQMRRKATLGLSLLSKSHPNEMKEFLMNAGYDNQMKWMDHCATLLDKKSREFALAMAKCYEN